MENFPSFLFSLGIFGGCVGLFSIFILSPVGHFFVSRTIEKKHPLINEVMLEKMWLGFGAMTRFWNYSFWASISELNRRYDNPKWLARLTLGMEMRQMYSHNMVLDFSILSNAQRYYLYIFQALQTVFIITAILFAFDHFVIGTEWPR